MGFTVRLSYMNHLFHAILWISNFSDHPYALQVEASGVFKLI